MATQRPLAKHRQMTVQGNISRQPVTRNVIRRSIGPNTRLAVGDSDVGFEVVLCVFWIERIVTVTMNNAKVERRPAATPCVSGVLGVAAYTRIAITCGSGDASTRIEACRIVEPQSESGSWIVSALASPPIDVVAGQRHIQSCLSEHVLRNAERAAKSD